MANNSVTVKYVTKKVSKTRIQPVSLNASGRPERFVTGTWDDTNNEISLWQFPENGSEPVLLSAVKFKGDCLDLQFVDSSSLVSASTTGSVLLHKIGNDSISEAHAWKGLHTIKNQESPCTGLAYHSSLVATIGENGSVNILSLQRLEPQQTINDADSCSLTTVCFATQNELLTGNFRGLMKLWDLRRTSNKPVRAMALAEDHDEGAASCARHPSQNHIIAVGGADGTLFIYDLRRPEIPVSVFAGPRSSINELKFHPSRPEFLLTCGEDGSAWQWTTANTWLENKVDIKELLPQLPLPVNSLDVCGERVVLGADNEAVYCFPAYVF